MSFRTAPCDVLRMNLWNIMVEGKYLCDMMALRQMQAPMETSGRGGRNLGPS